MVLADHDPVITFLCSPNNPTGCAISNADLDTLLSSTDALVMVDEAYGEFHSETAVDLLSSHPNLIILKTFSKAFGAAGVRIGYLIAHPDLCCEIIKGKIPFDINIFSHTAAMTILQHGDLLRERIAFICTERDRVFNRSTRPLKTALRAFKTRRPRMAWEG